MKNISKKQVNPHEEKLRKANELLAKINLSGIYMPDNHFVTNFTHPATVENK